jgi:hypothetical protein
MGPAFRFRARVTQATETAEPRLTFLVPLQRYPGPRAQARVWRACVHAYLCVRACLCVRAHARARAPLDRAALRWSVQLPLLDAEGAATGPCSGCMLHCLHGRAIAKPAHALRLVHVVRCAPQLSHGSTRRA